MEEDKMEIDEKPKERELTIEEKQKKEDEEKMLAVLNQRKVQPVGKDVAKYLEDKYKGKGLTLGDEQKKKFIEDQNKAMTIFDTKKKRMLLRI